VVTPTVRVVVARQSERATIDALASTHEGGADGPDVVVVIDADVPLGTAADVERLVDAVRAEAHRAAGSVGADFDRRLPTPVAAVVFDFDGVMTDDRVLVLEDGTEGVLANRSDGMGIEQLRATGVAIAVISKERNQVVAARCAKLGIECIQGTDDKWPVLEAWLDDRSIDAAQVVFVGNDVNDIECLGHAGCGVVVADAHRDARAVADLVLSRPGGHGAVRELTDALLRNRFA
jgi:YrbI family 3-deoxy-D-manno-octulosonate 8-phosphate phosphatase